MARKVIIDCDPGIDDVVAICLALFDPRLEVVAVTATAGNVGPEQASRNVQTILEQLDPPRLPRVGTASPAETVPHLDARQLHGDDGLGNCGFASSQLHHQHASDKIICDEIRAAPGQVSILCLGPLTNIARAFQRDPALVRVIDRLIILGGSVDGIGNVTATAEFNMYYDPASARDVFQTPTTKTLVPLDVIRKVPFTLDLIADLPDESTRAGTLLHRLIPFLFRSYHQTLGQESIYLSDALAVLAAVDPGLFQAVEMVGDVETRGQLTTGMTVFDRRRRPQGHPNMEVLVDVNAADAAAGLVRGLALAGRCTAG